MNTVDHHGFYRQAVPFYPVIEETSAVIGATTKILSLPSGLESDLNWSLAERSAEEAVAKGHSLLWEIDLGLSSFTWRPEDATSFAAFSLALDQFCASLFPRFKDHTFGVCLYRGSSDFLARFPYQLWEEAFLQWQEETGNRGADAYALFCTELLSDDLHRLVSLLPAEVIAFALFDVVDSPSVSSVARLFLQERFEFISVGLKGWKGPHAGLQWQQGYWAAHPKEVPVVGLFLPGDQMWSDTTAQQLDQVIAFLQLQKIPFRFIAEGKLTEQWDGLDQIIVASAALVSHQAHRKLQGFLAAGGSVEYHKES